MANVRPDWHWQPDAITLKAIMSGNNKVRRASNHSSTTEESTIMATKKKASKKKVAAKKSAPKKKLDGKKLAASRKPKDSISQYVKDQLNAGKKDVDKILEGALKEFPGTSPTRGYIRFIAKQIGVKGLEGSDGRVPKEPKAKAAKKKAAKGEAVASEKDGPKEDLAS